MSKDKKPKWDGKSRVSNDTYRKRFEEIFGKKTKKDEHLEFYEDMPERDVPLHEDDEKYLKELKDKL